MAIIPADEKVFMVDKRTNTTYGGSQALQDMQQWYTMQDVADSVAAATPYKVFTTLLTQSGGDSPANANYDNQVPLIIGQSYFIDDNLPLADGGTDFTNVGAANNNYGTWFIATGTTPIWGQNNGFLTYNEAAPVATVLENTIGNVWFTYENVGGYGIKSNDLFINNKTLILSTPFTADNGDVTTNVYFNKSSVNLMNIVVGDGDSFLNGVPIEIRVYN